MFRTLASVRWCVGTLSKPREVRRWTLVHKTGVQTKSQIVALVMVADRLWIADLENAEQHGNTVWCYTQHQRLVVLAVLRIQSINRRQPMQQSDWSCSHGVGEGEQIQRRYLSIRILAFF